MSNGQIEFNNACKTGDINFVKEHADNVNVFNRNSHAINLASSNGHLEVVKWLVTNFYTSKRKELGFAYFMSIENNHSDVTKYLKEYLINSHIML
jgi:hypothetical protein